MATIKCDLCGEELDDWAAFKINTGRRVRRLCSKCYLTGMKETGHRQHDKGTARIRKDEKDRFR